MPRKIDGVRQIKVNRFEVEGNIRTANRWKFISLIFRACEASPQSGYVLLSGPDLADRLSIYPPSQPSRFCNHAGNGRIFVIITSKDFAPSRANNPWPANFVKVRVISSAVVF